MERMLFIFIGYNQKYLLGCHNDAIIFYNLLDSQNLTNIIYKKNLLIGNDVTVSNLVKIFKNNKNINHLMIYFSGHGCVGGSLEFSDKIVNSLELYDLINTNFNNHLKLYLILDCCYSGSFPLVKNFQKITSVSILASCKNNQKSSESLVTYTPIPKKYNFFNYIKPTENIIVGAMTYNLIKLIKQYNLTDVDKWFSLENDPIWEKLEKLINQKITIIR